VRCGLDDIQSIELRPRFQWILIHALTLFAGFVSMGDTMNQNQRHSLKKIQSAVDRLWNQVEAIKEAEDIKNDRLNNGTNLGEARTAKQIRRASDGLDDIAGLLAKTSEKLESLVNG